jgi:hypothetical protein
MDNNGELNVQTCDSAMLHKEGHAHIHMKWIYISLYSHVHHMCFRHMTFVCKKHEHQEIAL